MNQNLDHPFFSKLRSALGHDPSRRRPWAALGPSLWPGRVEAAAGDRRDSAALLQTLKERSRINGISVGVVPDAAAAARAVAGIVKDELPPGDGPAHVVAWRHELIDRLDLEAVLAAEAPQVAVHLAAAEGDGEGESSRLEAKARAAAAVCGVTSADWCLADSATLVMRTRPGQGRAVSLLPPVHIAVIPLSSLIGNLADLYAALGRDGRTDRTGHHGLTNCMTFISGPSTTRDIESVAVPGAHGPRAVHIVVIG